MFFGTHGTSRTRAACIVETRCFLPTGEHGHAGAGIYFWSYSQNIKLAKHLAELWWQGYTKKGIYAKDEDPACAVVDVTINDPGEPKYIDATNDDFREALAEMAASLDGSAEFSFKKATSLLFTRLEEKSGEKILIAKVMLGSSNSKGLQSIVLRDFSMSPAYVIRAGGESLITNFRIAV